MTTTTHKIVCTATTGGAGASTSTTTYPVVVTGRVIGVGVTYSGTSAPATTDTTVRGAAKNVGAKAPIIAVVNANTNAWYQPFMLKDDSAGADIASNYVEPTIHDQVEVVVAQADDGVIVTVVLLVEC